MATETKRIAHSKAPWTVTGEVQDLPSDPTSGDHWIAIQTRNHAFDIVAPSAVERAEVKANAHLIAAAPDLLAVCKRFLDMYDDVRDLVGPSVKPAIEHAERAVAKAEGAR